MGIKHNKMCKFKKGKKETVPLYFAPVYDIIK